MFPLRRNPNCSNGYNSGMAHTDTKDAEIKDAEDRLGMTDDQWAQWQAYTHAYAEQHENGIDLSSLRENLRLSPTERLKKHQHALKLVKEVQNAGTRAGLPCPSSAS